MHSFNAVYSKKIDQESKALAFSDVVQVFECAIAVEAWNIRKSDAKILKSIVVLQTYAKAKNLQAVLKVANKVLPFLLSEFENKDKKRKRKNKEELYNKKGLVLEGV